MNSLLAVLLGITLAPLIALPVFVLADRRATGVWQWPREYANRWWKEGWWR